MTWLLRSIAHNLRASEARSAWADGIMREPGSLAACAQASLSSRTRSGMNRNSPPVVLKHDNALAALSTPTALIDWWIYFGTIQRERIVEIMRTDAPFCNDAERRIWLGIEEGLEPNETTAIMRADEKRQEPQAR
jgi:hypothetical protein